MTTKYGFSDVREQLVNSIKDGYPTKWEDFEAAKVLGEDIFGLPKPHPNAVLNLFLEQCINFALPFAAYQAGISGFSALVSDAPSTILQRFTLASIVRGMGEMRRVMAVVAHNIVCDENLGVCVGGACALGVGAGQRVGALNKIFKVMVEGSEGDMLSSLSLGPLVCMYCAKQLEEVHADCRRKYIWAAFPGLLGWRSWEGV